MTVKWKAGTENCSDLYTKNWQENNSRNMWGHLLVMTLTWNV